MAMWMEINFIEFVHAKSALFIVVFHEPVGKLIKLLDLNDILQASNWFAIRHQPSVKLRWIPFTHHSHTNIHMNNK